MLSSLSLFSSTSNSVPLVGVAVVGANAAAVGTTAAGLETEAPTSAVGIGVLHVSLKETDEQLLSKKLAYSFSAFRLTQRR